MLEKLRRKARIWPEQQRNLSFDVACIEMRYGHRRRSYRGFTVHLGIVAGRNRRIVAAKPDSTHRKPGVALPLGNLGFLQQWQRSAASTEEDEFGVDIPQFTAFFVPDLHTPPHPITAQILHSTEKVDAESILIT